jgi:anti-sigma-K factor RskA
MNANEHDGRLEEVAAYAIGALDPERVAELERHLADCERCQEELRRLTPAVRALPEAVELQTPPPELKQRLMDEVRADAAEAAQRRVHGEARAGGGSERRRAGGEARAEGGKSPHDPARPRSGVGEWLRGLNVAGLTWKPLAALAVAILLIAGGIGYAVGNGGSSGGAHTTKVEPGANGIAAKLVTEDDRGELHLAGVKPLPKGRVLEAWVERDGIIEAVPALFAPDQAGRASTTIESMKNVSAVMVTREPEGGSNKPTTKPIVEVPIKS